MVCLQETKLACVDDNVIIQTSGQQFVGSYFYLPAQGTRGGVIVACSHDLYTLQSVTTGQYSISAIITSRADNSQWSITGVYGPQEDQEKIQFRPCLDLYRFLQKSHKRIKVKRNLANLKY